MAVECCSCVRRGWAPTQPCPRSSGWWKVPRWVGNAALRGAWAACAILGGLLGTVHVMLPPLRGNGCRQSISAGPGLAL